MDKFYNRLSHIIRQITGVGSVFLVAVMGIVIANIILRGFGHSILGTYEAVELMIVVFIAFAFGWTTVNKAHIVMDMVTSRLPESVQRILSIIINIPFLGIWLLITWYTAGWAGEQLLLGEHTQLSKWPIYPFRYVLASGAAIMCLVIILDIIRAIKKVLVKK